MDCSDPYLIDKNTKLGYCKTGAELAVQLKPHGSYHCISYPLFLCHHDGIDSKQADAKISILVAVYNN